MRAAWAADQLVQAGGLDGKVRPGAPREELPPLALGEEGQLRNPAPGFSQGPDEKSREPSQEPLRRPSLEEVRAVGESPGQVPLAARQEGQAQVELLRPAAEGRGLGGEAGERQPGQGRVLERQHDLEERRVGEAPRRRQRLDQLFERQILVGVGSEGRLPQLTEEDREGRVGGQVRGQDEGVDEEADQTLGLQPVPVGDRRAHDHPLLPGEPREEGLEGGEEDHEGRRSPAPAEPAHLGAEPQLDRQAGAPEARDRRPRTVGRQLDHLRHSRQALLPPAELAGQHLPGEPGPLPDGEVRILDGERRQGGRPALDERAVDLPQLAHQHPHRPAVADDVMEVDPQQVPGRAQAKKRGP